MQVEEVLKNAKKYTPAVLQNESHPYLHEKDLRDFCRTHNIVFQVKISIPIVILMIKVLLFSKSSYRPREDFQIF